MDWGRATDYLCLSWPVQLMRHGVHAVGCPSLRCSGAVDIIVAIVLRRPPFKFGLAYIAVAHIVAVFKSKGIRVVLDHLRFVLVGVGALYQPGVNALVNSMHRGIAG